MAWFYDRLITDEIEAFCQKSGALIPESEIQYLIHPDMDSEGLTLRISTDLRDPEGRDLGLDFYFCEACRAADPHIYGLSATKTALAEESCDSWIWEPQTHTWQPLREP